MKRERPMFLLFCPLMALLFGTAVYSQDNQDAPRVTHSLHVSRFHTTSLSQARIDRIINDMGQILRAEDGPNDAPCNVNFSRSGVVGTFTTGDGSLDNPQELDDAFALPGRVKVVNQVRWCSGAPAPNAIGCALRPGNSIVLVPFRTNEEGVLWAHEFGHNQGLRHRRGRNLLMNNSINPAMREISRSECNSFRQP